MDLNPRKYSHFNGLHLGDTSTFSSTFPIDRGIDSINQNLATLPVLIDSALTIQGAPETFETIAKKGDIPLQPVKTTLSIEKLEDTEARRITKGRHFVFSSITEGASLHSAQLRLDREKSSVEGLFLICHGMIKNEPVSIELRAAINSTHEEAYEIVTYKPGEEDNSYLVDAGVASEFIHALRETQAGHELPSLPKEAGLLELLEKSPHFSHYESGEYDLDGNANLFLRIERDRKIRKGVARTGLLLVELEETSFNDEIETIRQFGVQIKAGRPTAWLNYLVRSLDGKIPGEERASMFEKVSTHLRENPEILFGALQDSTNRLASLE